MFGYDIPTTLLAAMIVSFFAGSLCPAYYAQERLRGFGRAMFAAIPAYRPPPGMSEKEAMRAALESAEDEEADIDGDTHE
ncbi:hypothetical protein [Halosimplex sp. J119]